MPVTALPASNTIRYRLKYTVNTVPHSMLMRVAAGQTDTDANNIFHALLTAAAPILNQYNTITLEKAVVGSDVFNPVTWTGSASYGAGVDDTTINRVLSMCFVGRDSLGHKVRLFMFGPKGLSGTGDYRISGVENATISTLVGTLNGYVNVFRTIADNDPVWKSYAELNISKHWEKKLRS
jgi:hypothetical protein